ncbi:hypothetical protein OQA88_1172 [Cercophora sp. LCS_1]
MNDTNSGTVYDTTFPLFIRGLRTLLHLLQKATTYSKDQNLPRTTIPAWRLHADMKPFTFQVQMVTNMAKRTAERLTGKPQDSFADKDETTLDELAARVTKAVRMLQRVDRADVVAHGNAREKLAIRGREMDVTPREFVDEFAQPNFFFHLVMVYSLLRMHGVEVGKFDYLGGFLGER